LRVQENYNLSGLNTFGLDIKARYFVRVQDKESLYEALEFARDRQHTVLVLGGGSNIVFSGDYGGLVLTPDFRGVDIARGEVSAGAGENWHRLVRHTLDAGLSGLENLSLIPGHVGAAPIQNIGAYGQELENVFLKLEATNIRTGEDAIFQKSDCEFGYRASIFKNNFRDCWVITRVYLTLSEVYSPILAYKDVQEEVARLQIDDPAPENISDIVIAIRRRKLPDVSVQGNVGSFFKNPIISSEQRDKIQQEYADLPSRHAEDHQYKIPAAWLIEHAGMKGMESGGAMVSEQHALVFVNIGSATVTDVARLTELVSSAVHKHFGIQLEIEPAHY
jgi:UDP-N-acetylmuramate dehydrogenase